MKKKIYGYFHVARNTGVWLDKKRMPSHIHTKFWRKRFFDARVGYVKRVVVCPKCERWIDEEKINKLKRKEKSHRELWMEQYGQRNIDEIR